GAKASGMHVALSCTPQNVPGFAHNDCTNSFYAGAGDTISCTVRLADRFGNVLGVATRADFRSEAGAPGPPVLTKAYDPARGGDQTADLGHASDTVLVTGYPLPADVLPLGGEFSKSYDAGCGNAIHNPRDGLATVIVAVQGEEGFVDLNGNGVYDMGEPFVDAGEPFIDANDNNIRDQDEFFIDVNQNGKWDGPNGVWDAQTVVWGETRIVYTGAAEPSASRWLDPADVGMLPGPTQGVFFLATAMPPTSTASSVYFSDQNFNPLASFATYSIGSIVGNSKASYTSPPNKGDSLGVTFQQQFCSTAPPAAPGACFSTCKSAPCYRVT